MKKLFSITIFFLAVLFLAGLVSAASIPSVGTLPGEKTYIYSVDQWYTTGMRMEGLQITVTYADNTTNKAHWVNGVGAEGTDGNWSVSFSSVFLTGDDLWNWNQFRSYIDWDVTNLGTKDIASIVFEGMTEYSDLVFDIINDPIRDPPVTGELVNEYTPDSADGRPIELDDGPAGLDIYADYSDQVHLKEWNSSTGEYEYNWYGDLYATLTLTFYNSDGTAGELSSGEVITFSADLDNVNVSVPEPATILLMGMGLGLTGLMRNRLRRKK